MKIIERRDPDTRRKRCCNCQSLLEYTREDIYNYNLEQSQYAPAPYIECPVCIMKNILRDNDII